MTETVSSDVNTHELESGTRPTKLISPGHQSHQIKNNLGASHPRLDMVKSLEVKRFCPPCQIPWTFLFIAISSPNWLVTVGLIMNADYNNSFTPPPSWGKLLLF